MGGYGAVDGVRLAYSAAGSDRIGVAPSWADRI